MSNTREITLGDKAFAVPPLPLRLNRYAYPLCRDLIASGLIDRCAVPGAVLEVTDAELQQLAEVAFLGAQAADRDLTREAFDDMAITPIQLLEAFFGVMPQTGAFAVATAAADAPAASAA